jgi:peptidoglycan/LPS O-acetylase OafA/YrhL
VERTAPAPAPAPVRRLGRRPALDGLRGLAVLLVIFDHAHLPLRAAWIGVDLFFVLSGFLITSLLLEERARDGRISLRGFYARRARRILPGLAVLTVGVVAVSLTLHQLQDRWPWWAQVATTWSFTSNATVWLAGAPIGAFTATWSLACEEQFYLLWPLAVVVTGRRGWGPGRLLAALGAAVAGLALAAWIATVTVHGSDAFFSPLGRGAELMLGCALAVAWRHRLLPSWTESPWVSAGALALCTLLVVRTPLGTEATYLLGAACAAVLMVGLLAERSRLLVGAFTLPPLRYTGRISYGLYLFNDAISRLLHHNLPGRPWQEIAPLLLAGSFACAALSYHLVEARFLRRRPRPTARQDVLAAA